MLISSGLAVADGPCSSLVVPLRTNEIPAMRMKSTTSECLSVTLYTLLVV